MSQAAKTIADGSGAAVLAAINATFSRFASMASGTARPSDIEAGELWRETDNPGAGVHSVWLYDGASDVLLGTLNTSTHVWSAVIPTVDLTSGVTGVLPRANGGFTPATITAALGANVALNNTGSYFDGPAIAQGTSGTWLVFGSVTVTSGAIANINAKLWDGTTVIASGRSTVSSANEGNVISLIGIIASPAGNLRISCNDATRTDGTIQYNMSGAGKDSLITAIRIA